MSTHVIVEGESLDDARKELNKRVPNGLHSFSENVISDGNPTTLRMSATTQEEAFQLAAGRVPDGSQILSTSLINAPKRSVISIRAFDDRTLKAEILRQFGDSTLLVKATLLASGRKGLLGIGKTRHFYEVEIFQQAVVAITYKSKAQISAKIGRLDEMMGEDPNKVNAFCMAVIMKTIETQCLPAFNEKDINKVFKSAVPLFYKEWEELLNTQFAAHMERLSSNRYDMLPPIKDEDVFETADHVVRRVRGLI